MSVRVVSRVSFVLAISIFAIAIAGLVGYFPLDAETTGAEAGHYEATNTTTLTSLVPGDPRGETNAISIPAGDMNYSQRFTFEPAGVTITPSCNIPGGRDHDFDGNATDPGETVVCLAAAAASGLKTSNSSYSLLNGPCNTSVQVDHDLYAIPTPNNEPNPRLSTNILYPRPEGSTDRFGGWDTTPPPAGGGSFVPTANATNPVLQYYPSYLLDLFDPDGAGTTYHPEIPQAVYGGFTGVAGAWTPFYIVQFNAGILNVDFAVADPPHPFSRFAPALGHPNMQVLNDPTATIPSPASASLCFESAGATTLPAMIGGIPRATNPPTAGTHFTLHFTASYRDLDNDGYENTIDSCPDEANIEDPRTDAGPDNDNLDSACDPFPLTTNPNEDVSDTLTNGEDNCPLAPNGSQADSEILGAYSASAFDGGPELDEIGDACDSGGTTPASIVNNGVSYAIARSITVSNGHYHIQANVVPQCYGAPPTDVDGDGYCAADSVCLGACIVDTSDDGICALPPAPPAGTAPTCSVRRSAWTTTASYSAILTAFDSDRGGGDTSGTTDPGGIGTIACPGGTADLCPENGFDSDWIEDYAGTNPAMPCSQNTGLNNEPQDNWLYDINDDQSAGISDLVVFGAALGIDNFGKSYNSPFNTFVNDTVLPNTGSPRFDLNSDGITSLSDLILYGPVFNKSCRMVNGTRGTVQ